jgi:hypothetical protein
MFAKSIGGPSWRRFMTPAPVLRGYIRRMSKRQKPATELRWRITRIKSTPAAEIGSVSAPDAVTAIRKAIEEFQIPKAQHSRLVARRIS